MAYNIILKGINTSVIANYFRVPRILIFFRFPKTMKKCGTFFFKQNYTILNHHGLYKI